MMSAQQSYQGGAKKNQATNVRQAPEGKNGATIVVLAIPPWIWIV
jgi:hypothetical protein